MPSPFCRFSTKGGLKAKFEFKGDDVPFEDFGLAFESQTFWNSKLKLCNLEAVVRQSDGLVDYLHALRTNADRNTPEMKLVHQQLTQNNGVLPTRDDGIKPTTLFPTNILADRKNQAELRKLNTDLHAYEAQDWYGLNEEVCGIVLEKL